MPSFENYYGKDKNTLYYPKPSSILKKYIDRVKGSDLKALDLGCGDGRNAIYISKNNFHVSCFDLSQNAIDKIRSIATKENLKITAEVADITQLQFENNKFDLIIASTIFDHLQECHCQLLINNVKCWLKDLGFIYVGVFTENDPAYKIRLGKLNEFDKKFVSETGHFIKYFFKSGELKKHFKEFNHIYYYEGMKEDLTHGKPHYHGLARIFCQKII